VHDRVPDRTHIYTLAQPRQLPVTVLSHRILGQDAEPVPPASKAANPTSSPARRQMFEEVVVDYGRLTLELVAMEMLVVVLYLTWAKPADLGRRK
jgi:hypothetical protein